MGGGPCLGVPAPRERADFGHQLKHAIANCCCQLANKTEKRFRLSQITLDLFQFVPVLNGLLR